MEYFATLGTPCANRACPRIARWKSDRSSGEERILLERLRYVRLPTSNAAISTAFVQEIIGLQIGEMSAGIARFRSDDRTYTLEYDASGTTDHPTVAVEVRSQNVLANLFEALSEHGLSPKRLDAE